MSSYHVTVDDSTPRLEVRFNVDERGRDTYEWGMKPPFPVLNLLSAIVRLQHELQTNPGWAWQINNGCPEKKIVLAWIEGQKKFYWFAHQDTPVDGMVGMLEMIKQTIVATQVARRTASQQMILGPDGNPMRR